MPATASSPTWRPIPPVGCAPPSPPRSASSARTLEHAAGAGAQREHVPRAHEVAATAGGVEDLADRRGPVLDADARTGAGVVDRHAERRVARRTPGRDHRIDVELVETARVAGHADEPAGPAQHEVDGFPRHPAGGHREVAFVLAVFVVDDEHHLASTNTPQRLVDRGQLHCCAPQFGTRSGCAAAPGSVTTMRQPCGSRRSGWMSPPCRSTIHCAIARPSPAPPSLDARAVSVR